VRVESRKKRGMRWGGRGREDEELDDSDEV